MRKVIIGYIIFSIIVFVSLFRTESHAREIDYFQKPQAGIWFGILTPIYTTYSQLNTSLGGGGFFRFNSPVENIKIGLDSSYQYYEHKGLYGVNNLTLWPVYGNLLYKLPMPAGFPLRFQVKAGAGGSWVRIRPDDIAQWDPMGMLGFETSFGAGRLVNIAFRIDYLFIYESYRSGAERDGHFLNSCITLYFNLF